MTIATARLDNAVARAALSRLAAYRPKPAPKPRDASGVPPKPRDASGVPPKPRDARPCRMCGGNVRKSRMMRHDWICSKCERARGWK